jgi:bifunctional UDP-N-acetylglucosamine pyrophosphorylase/glucosamine-1-phosphate N-acetyltransferase
VAAFVSSRLADPGRLGRVERDGAGRVTRIVEAADYQGPGGPGEINAGQYAFDAAWLWAHIDRIPLSPKGEYYLTELVAMACAEGTAAAAVEGPADEVLGVDDRVALARAEGVMRERLLREHMLNGVTIVDPATTYIHAGVEIAPDTTILPNCHLHGRSRVASGCTIGPATTLRNSAVGEGSTVQASVIEESTVGARVRIGPFAHVRGGAVVGDDCEIGNYAEIKNSNVARGVKMHHFAYLGDADVGERTNLAAGMITCNFDGVEKHRTTIGADVFVGCDTMLIAPVTLGDGSYTATGSVVLSGRDVPPGGRVAGVPAKPLRPRESREE